MTADKEQDNSDLDDLLGSTEDKAAADKAAAEDRQLLWQAAYSGPSPYANRFLITHHGSVIRLAFVEQPAPLTNLQFRAAATLTLDDAIDLHRVLGGFLSGILQNSAEEAQTDATRT